MSLFSRVKKSRQQAKEHNEKLAEQQKKEKEKTPYRHVPTHAATDAIASAPPSWREADRPRILEQNRRRSAMAASGHHMNMPGIPRVGSSLSHVSYPTDTNANPVVRMPRAYSYTGISPYSADQSGDVVYSLPDVTTSQLAATSKGKEVFRGPSYEVSRISSTSSKEESGSSSGSTSSQDDLEMKPARVTATVEMSRLRPSHRRTSDSSIERIAMANSAKGVGLTNAPRDARPPPSMRGFGSIAPIANAPIPMLESPSSGNSMSSRQNSTTSLSGQMPIVSTSAPMASATAPAAQPDKAVNRPKLPSQTLDAASTAESVGMTHTAAPGKFKDGKTLKTTRFTELERIDSQVETPAPEASSYTTQSTAPPPVAQAQVIVNVFPEEDSVPEPEHQKSSKSKRFSRSGGKLMRKDLWASSKAPAVAV